MLMRRAANGSERLKVYIEGGEIDISSKRGRERCEVPAMDLQIGVREVKVEEGRTST